MRTIVFCLVATLAMLVTPAFAGVQVNEKTDVLVTVYCPCADGGLGEEVQLEGTFHDLVTLTINGKNVSGKMQVQGEGSGTGQTTGDKYEFNGLMRESFKTSLQNGQETLSYLTNFRLIGQGSGNNILIHATMHVTINANGTVTVTHDNFSAECK